MGDLLPERDADFLVWLANFQAYAAAHGAALGFSAADLADLLARQQAFEAGYAANLAAKEAAVGAARTKKDQRTAAERCVRGLVRKLAAAGVPGDRRAALGLPRRDGHATRVARPTTRPLLQIELGTAQQQRLRFGDETTPTHRKKPRGVRAAEIWWKKGGAEPATEADWTFLAAAGATPFVRKFLQEEVGTSVWYRARWLNTRNEPGPWSAAISAKVPG